jgi:hypothetical protein
MTEEKTQVSACASHRSGYLLKKQCDECPWRKDQPVGRFTAKRFEELRVTATQPESFSGIEQQPIFACHKTIDGKEQTCVGFLANEASSQNFSVRLALMNNRYNPEELVVIGEQYKNYEEMALANGATPLPPKKGPAWRHTK